MRSLPGGFLAVDETDIDARGCCAAPFVASAEVIVSDKANTPFCVHACDVIIIANASRRAQDTTGPHIEELMAL